MKKSLKILSLLLCILLIFTVTAACGNKKGSVSGNSSVTSTGNNNSSTTESSKTSGSSDTITSSTEGTSSDTTVSGETSGTAVSGNPSDSTASRPADDTAPTVYLEAEKSGDTVTVTAKIQNNPGLVGFQFSVTYNEEAVTPKAVKDGITPIRSNLQQSTDCKGAVTAVYTDAVGFNGNGVLFTVTFDVKDASKTAEFTVKTAHNSFLDQNADKFITFECKGTSVSLN